MLHFLIDNWPEELREGVEATIFELALRVGSRFAIHRSPASLPADVYVVHYGGAETAVSSGRGLELPVVRRAWTGQAHFRTERRDGRTLWVADGGGERVDVVAGAHDLMTFGPERRWEGNIRDDLGRILPTTSPWYAEDLFLEPLVENNADQLRDWMELAVAAGGDGSSPWGPGNFAVAISHDVDGPRLHSLFALARSGYLGLLRGNRRERESFLQGLMGRLLRREDPYWAFAHWRALEALWSARSTLFFYPGRLKSAPRFAKDPHYEPRGARFLAEIAAILDQGSEIGLHVGVRAHRLEAYREGSQRLIEQGVGQVCGARAHYWTLDWADPHRCWREMARAGLKYDASLNPMTIGYRGGAMLPVCAGASCAGVAPAFLAIPTALMDSYLVPSFTGQEPAETRRRVDRVVARAKRPGGLLVLDWHVRSLANFGAYAGYLDPLLNILDPLREDSSCRFLTLAEVASEWSDYRQRQFQGFGGERGKT